MKKIIVPFCFIATCCFSALHAQQMEWVRQIGGTDSDFGVDISVDTAGTVYTAGYFEGTVDFDPGTAEYNLVAAFNEDGFVSALDASGHFLWAKQFEANTSGSSSQCSAITASDSGNVYVCGTFSGVVDFDPGPGVTTLNSNYGNSFICKLDSQGNFIWVKEFLGIGGLVFNEDILVDGMENVYTTGEFSGTIDFDPAWSGQNLSAAGGRDIFVSSLDASGNFVWARRIGGTDDDYGNAIGTDDLGNIYLAGMYSDTVDFNPDPLQDYTLAAEAFDGFVVKLDNSGNFAWATAVNGTGNNQVNAIAADNPGRVCITGTFSETADFDPGPDTYELTSNGSIDLFVVELDTSGNFSWARSLGSDSEELGNDIVCDGAGNSYVTGSFRDTAYFDAGSGLNPLIASGGSDILTFKLDASGNVSWTAVMGGLSNSSGKAIAVNSQHDVFTTGSFYATTDFDPGPDTNAFTSVGLHDIFIHKLGQCYPSSGTDTVIACESYTWIDDSTYTASTDSSSFTLVNASGCDSVVTLNLTINPEYQTAIDTTISEGTSITIGDIAFDMSGSFVIVLQSDAGCDSIVNLDLSVVSTAELLTLSPGSLQLYPNPANDHTTIAQLPDGALIRVSDLSGKTLYQAVAKQEPVKIVTAGLTSGMYLVTIENDTFRMTRKLLVQH